MAVSGEQRSPDILFQRADLPAQHRLRDVQLLGRTAEVQRVGDRDKIAQLAQVQIHNASRDGRCHQGIAAAKRGLGH